MFKRKKRPVLIRSPFSHSPNYGAKPKSEKEKEKRKAIVLRLLVAAMLLMLGAGMTSAAPAPDANSVLILDIAVSGGASSLEAMAATAAGHTVVVVSDTTWLAMSAADFASYRALVLGDATCPGVGTSP